MENRWDDREASRYVGPLGECVYGSRLIGSDPDLVLHGGGNTSVKHPFVDITGRDVDALWVKGSGWDLGTIEAPGFTPLPLPRLDELVSLPALSDPDMMRELSAARLDPAAPQPSVETLLHALLPHPAVQHSHADVIVTLTNLADGEDRVRAVFGDRVVIVPYVMPGFDLARAVREIWPQDATDDTIGMVLLNHGLFTFGDTTRVAYDRHVELLDRAERWLDEQAPLPTGAVGPLPDIDPVELASLRRELSAVAGRPMITTRHTDECVCGFVGRADLADVATRGPLTPDHVIRTKRTPLVGCDPEGDDVGRYAEQYRDYYDRNVHRARTETQMLDPAPRVVLDERLGMVTAGASAKDADIAADIYHHTMPVVARSTDHLGGYVALPEGDLFDCEYWDLEQAKLRRAGTPPEMTGSVAVVTGAASGIGKACASALLDRGAAVVGLDLTPSVADAFDGPSWLGVPCDVTDPDAQSAAIGAAVERFGGIDIAVVAAGIFGTPGPIAELTPDEWRRVMAVNVDAVADLFTAL
ncbi:MAG: SDR family NAD(P)-dependent oxidoreductase, partial [Ilumatobacteraceae bacterium]